MSDKESNPVIQYVDGVEIRKSNKVTITYGADEYTRLVRLQTRFKQFNLSIAKLVAMMSQPCGDCGSDNIHIVIPRGILSTKRSFTGGTRTSKEKNNDAITRQDPEQNP